MDRFLERYPTATACAAAALADVLREWHGLGYPRRARNLHEAGLVVTGHGGRVPDDLTALLALPGVGPYTARAVLAFAYERDVGVVETNIARVLARTAGHRLTATAVQHLADAAVPSGDGWAWNQVLMDLGATVCRPSPGAPSARSPDVSVAPCRAPGARSGRRLGRGEHGTGAVRGQRPPGPRRRAAGAGRRCPIARRPPGTHRRRARPRRSGRASRRRGQTAELKGLVRVLSNAVVRPLYGDRVGCGPGRVGRCASPGSELSAPSPRRVVPTRHDDGGA